MEERLGHFLVRSVEDFAKECENCGRLETRYRCETTHDLRALRKGSRLEPLDEPSPQRGEEVQTLSALVQLPIQFSVVPYKVREDVGTKRGENISVEVRGLRT